MTASIWSTVGRLAGAMVVVATVALGVGCAELADPVEDYYHPDGWLSAASDNFHGAAVLASVNKAESCQTCHGENYGGGTSEVACTQCHASYPHEAAFGGPPRATHVAFMQEQAGWDLSTCQTCHGEDYAGKGVEDKSCLTCHSQPEGPEACNTCHGEAATGVPPPDLLGSTATTVPGVGAHAVHAPSDAGSEVCLTCHVVPESYAADGHIDADPARAELVFGGLAVHSDAAASYDPATNTCSNTYCHGGFAFAKSESPYAFAYTADFIEGNAADVVWTDVGSGQAQCGTCHGLPPTGHVPAGPGTCGNCHSSFPDTHMDGMINVFGSSR